MVTGFCAIMYLEERINLKEVEKLLRDALNNYIVKGRNSAMRI